MGGYNFADSTRNALAAAKEEARSLGHGYVGTEHLLLGLLRVDDPVVMAALRGVEIDPSQLWRAVLAKIPSRATGGPSGPDVPYTSRTKKGLEEAMVQAREFDHGYVGSAHLLLGLAREGQGIAAQALLEAGTDLPRLTAEVVRVLGTDVGRQDRATGVSKPSGFIPHVYTDALIAAPRVGAIIIALLALVTAVVALIVALSR